MPYSDESAAFTFLRAMEEARKRGLVETTDEKAREAALLICTPEQIEAYGKLEENKKPPVDEKFMQAIARTVGPIHLEKNT